MRKPLIAANWKMNMNMADAGSLVKGLEKEKKILQAVDLLILPPYTMLSEIAKILSDSDFFMGGQNCHQEPSGAYTGEISAEMLVECGCSYVLLGHSERRNLFGEVDEVIRKKMAAAINTGLSPILCVGEKLDARKAGLHKETVANQLRSSLQALDIIDGSNFNLTIAYEPVWAIGTGVAAGQTEVEEMAGLIRDVVAVCMGKEIALSARILYGGSVSPENISSFSSCSDIDGALVGGASLHLKSFLPICTNFVVDRM